MDFQDITSRTHLSSLMVRITISPWRRELGLLGLYIKNKNSFLPDGENPRDFHCQDRTARVYNRFPNYLMLDPPNNSEEYFDQNASLSLQSWSSNHEIRHIIISCSSWKVDSLTISIILIPWFWPRCLRGRTRSFDSSCESSMFIVIPPIAVVECEIEDGGSNMMSW